MEPNLPEPWNDNKKKAHQKLFGLFVGDIVEAWMHDDPLDVGGTVLLLSLLIQIVWSKYEPFVIFYFFNIHRNKNFSLLKILYRELVCKTNPPLQDEIN